MTELLKEKVKEPVRIFYRVDRNSPLAGKQPWQDTVTKNTMAAKKKRVGAVNQEAAGALMQITDDSSYCQSN